MVRSSSQKGDIHSAVYANGGNPVAVRRFRPRMGDMGARLRMATGTHF